MDKVLTHDLGVDPVELVGGGGGGGVKKGPPPKKSRMSKHPNFTKHFQISNFKAICPLFVVCPNSGAPPPPLS